MKATPIRFMALLGLQLAFCVGLAGCFTDDLGLQTTTAFTLTSSPAQPLARVGVPVKIRLQISPTQFLNATDYEVSFQNALSKLPVSVKMNEQNLVRGHWLPLTSLDPLMVVNCDSVGSPNITFIVRDQVQNLQSVAVTYTTTP